MVHFDPKSAPVGERIPWQERWVAIKAAAPVILLMVAVFGGLYSGVFTVTEAASVAAVLSLLFALARGRLNWTTLLQGLRESAAATGMIYVMIMGALIFTYFLNLGRVPEAFVGWISHLDMPPLAIIMALLVAYLILGAVFDEISAMLITLPLVLPVVQKLALTMMPGVTPEMVGGVVGHHQCRDHRTGHDHPADRDHRVYSARTRAADLDPHDLSRGRAVHHCRSECCLRC